MTVNHVTFAESPKKATCPQYIMMDLSKAKEIGFEIPTGQETLQQILD